MFRKILSFIIIYCLIFSSAMLAAAERTIVVDQSAAKNNRPQSLNTAGGVPQVNIATPNQTGLSHNKYTQFDVDGRGLILNNSNRQVQTRLGGWVEGNPNLASGSAKIILNEVRSSRPSRIGGYIEVSGARAEVVVANPSGISVDGGGFINTSRGTLTTGKPQIDPTGRLSGYEVNGGHIEINGKGLDGRETDYTDIISRTAAVNAGIWANDLKVTTGHNRVSQDHSRIVPLGPDDAVVSLDVSALGGMYAGHIRLIGTDKGLGVRNAGSIMAQARDMVITQEGRLENGGVIQGTDELSITTQLLENRDKILSEGKLAIVAERLLNSGQIQSTGELLVTVPVLENSGQLLADGRVTIEAAIKVVNGGLIQGLGEFLIVTPVLENLGQILSGGAGEIKAAASIQSSGVVQAANALSIATQVLDNHAKIISGGKAVITAAARVVNTALIQAGNALSIATKSLNNSGEVLSGGGSKIVASARLDNTGSIEAADLSLTTGIFQNSDQVLADTARITANELHNTGIFDGGEMVIRADFLENVATGTIIGTHLALAGNTIINGLALGQNGEIGKGGLTASGLIGARERLDIATANLTNREDGLIYSGGDFYIGGSLDASHQATGRGGTILNSSAVIDIGGDFYAVVTDFKNINAHYATVIRIVKEWDFQGYGWEGDEEVYIHGRNGSWGGGVDDRANGSDEDGNSVHNSEDFYIYYVHRVERNTFVTQSRPGFVYTGGDFVVDGNFTNDHSRVIVGGGIKNAPSGKFAVDGVFRNIAALMDAGLLFAEEYDIRPGISLSPEQMAILTSDIVLLEYVTVDTPNGPVTALAPKVYLAPGRDSVLNPGNGTLIAAREIDIDTADFENSGTIYASKTVSVDADNIDNSGTIGGDRLYLTALNDLNNIGGSIVGAELVELVAGGDINIESSTQTTTTSGGGHEGSRTAIDRVGLVTVKNKDGHLSMDAGGDINLKAAQVDSAGSAELTAGNDINIGGIETSYEYKSWSDSDNSRYYAESTDIGSSVTTGGDLALNAGRDILVTGSNVVAEGDITGNAGRDILITEGRAEKELEDHVFVAEGTSLGGEKTTSISASKSSDTAIGSGLSGDKISLTAGNDAVIRGSDVAAGNGLNLTTGGDITIEGAENYAESSYSHETTREGINGSFSGGRVGIGYSKSEQGREESNQSLWHSGSMVGSIDGTVNIYADRDVNIAGSQVVAGSGNVIISGHEVTIENQLDEYDSQSRQWAEEKGLTISVGLSGAGSAIGSAISQGKDFLDKITQAKDSQSDRAKGLYGLAAGRDLYDLAQGLPEVKDEIGGILGMGGGDAAKGGGSSSIGVSIGASYGQSKSESKSESHQETVIGSGVSSGANTVIVARGDENGKGGDLNIIGSTVDAGGKVTIAANNDLNIKSAEENSSYENENKSSDLGLSVSYGVGGGAGGGGAGWGGSASYSQSKGEGKGSTTDHVESIISGGTGVDFISGNDTTIKGGQIIGDKVTGLVGGDLTIESEQDTASHNQSQTSIGGGVSLGSEGNNASLNYQDQEAESDYKSVNDQSGIFAGNGGFDITVDGNTGLIGAVIDSTADSSKNSLTTGTLTVEDIENESSYSAETSGGGLGMTAGKDFTDPKGSLMPGLPMEESGNDSSTTKSAVAEGNITITDEAGQQAKTGQSAQEAIDSLNRDTENAHNGPLDKAPDLSQILAEQAEIADAAGQAGAAVAKTVGDISLKLYAETGDEKWAEGGAYKALLQAAGSALVAQLGNGAGLEAAMGAMASQLAAGKIDELVKQIVGSITDDPTQAEFIANMLANALSGGIGATVGGTSGANAAANMDRYNRQLHTIEKIMIAAYAKELLNSLKTDELCAQVGLCNLTEEQLVGIMTQSVLRNIDNNWKNTLPAEDKFQDDVYKFLVNKAYENGLNLVNYTNENGQPLLLFTATEKQKDNPFMFIDNFKDKDYYDFIIANVVPKNDDKRDLALFLANHAEEVEFWNNIDKALNEYPLDFALDAVKESLSYLLSGDEMGNDIADFLQHYLEYTDKYLPDLEKYYRESYGEKTDGEYEHAFTYDKTLPQLLETIYGGGASDVIYKDEAKKQLDLYIAVLGAKNILDAAASAGLKKAELEALEKAVKKQEASGLTTAKRQELLDILHQIEAAKNQTNGKFVAPGITTDNLSDAARAMDPADKGGNLTSAGRAAQKHGSRPGSAFPQLKGNPEAMNAQGQVIVESILNDPGRTSVFVDRRGYGKVLEITASDGRTLRFSADGKKLIGFLEP